MQQVQHENKFLYLQIENCLPVTLVNDGCKEGLVSASFHKPAAKQKGKILLAKTNITLSKLEHCNLK